MLFVAVTNENINLYGKIFFYIFMCLSLRRDVLWYTNVRLSVRSFHMSRSNLRTPWQIHFKLRIVIGIDSLMICILFGEIPELWDFIHQIVGDFSYAVL